MFGPMCVFLAFGGRRLGLYLSSLGQGPSFKNSIVLLWRCYRKLILTSGRISFFPFETSQNALGTQRGAFSWTNISFPGIRVGAREANRSSSVSEGLFACWWPLGVTIQTSAHSNHWHEPFAWYLNWPYSLRSGEIAHLNLSNLRFHRGKLCISLPRAPGIKWSHQQIAVLKSGMYTF